MQYTMNNEFSHLMSTHSGTGTLITEVCNNIICTYVRFTALPAVSQKQDELKSALK